MSRTENALERLSKAVERLESAAESYSAGGAGADATLQAEIERLEGEKAGLTASLRSETDKNRELGGRLDTAIEKLNGVLEQN